MSKISIREIKERYRASKEKERKFKWTYYVRRPISYYLAWPFLSLGISATGVTAFWLVIAIIGCSILAMGGYYNMIIGTALLEFAVILDCVDGHIARFTRPTKTGDILDTWSGEILLVGSLFSIGIGLANSPGLISANNIIPGTIDSTRILTIGAFTAILSLSSWTTRLHWRTNALKFMPDTAKSSEPDGNIRSRKGLLIIDNLFHYSGALTMLMVIAAIFAVLDIFLIMIGLIYAVYLLTIMYKIIQTARTLDRTGANSPNANGNVRNAIDEDD